jgi:hypothetical protein
MENRVIRLESTVAHLTERLGDLEQRLAVLEGHAPVRTETSADGARFAAIVGLGGTRVQQVLGLVGRTLVVLGGAYLLRALTESQVLPAPAGVALGLLYGAPWLLLASRAGARGSQLDAFAHALTTALIGYPLVWEATLRFNVITPEQGAVLLGVLTGSALVLSAACALQGLAWVVTFGAVLSAAGLAMATGSWTAYAVLAIAVGIATLWLGYTQDWTLLRWPAAAAANAMVLIVAGRVAGGGHVRTALAVQMLMLAGFLGSFAIRTLFIGRPVIPFEVAQSIAVLLVAFGGAISLIRSTGSHVVLVGAASLVLAIAGYIVAFSFVERHRDVKTFFFYTLLAQVFAIVGIGLCAGYSGGSLAYAAVAVVAAVLARRSGRLSLALQAMVYAIAAALASGLGGTATLALVAPPTLAWGSVPSAAGLVAFGALAIVTLLPVRRSIESWGIFASIQRLVLIAAFVWTALGMAVAISVTLLPDAAHMDGSVLATIRTAVLAMATLALARAPRYPLGREAGWLVYPLVFVTGMKLLLADFPQGRPGTLFAALALYGFTLIAAPRMLRHRRFRPPLTPIASLRHLPSGQIPPRSEARPQRAAENHDIPWIWARGRSKRAGGIRNRYCIGERPT